MISVFTCDDESVNEQTKQQISKQTGVSLSKITQVRPAGRAKKKRQPALLIASYKNGFEKYIIRQPENGQNV